MTVCADVLHCTSQDSKKGGPPQRRNSHAAWQQLLLHGECSLMAETVLHLPAAMHKVSKRLLDLQAASGAECKKQSHGRGSHKD